LVGTQLEEERRAAAADWPPSASITSGLVYSMLAIGISVGPALAGWLFDVTGSYASGFRAAAGFCLAAAIVSCGLLPPKQKLPPNHDAAAVAAKSAPTTTAAKGGRGVKGGGNSNEGSDSPGGSSTIAKMLLATRLSSSRQKKEAAAVVIVTDPTAV
jgi:MFS family permease